MTPETSFTVKLRDHAVVALFLFSVRKVVLPSSASTPKSDSRLQERTKRGAQALISVLLGKAGSFVSSSATLFRLKLRAVLKDNGTVTKLAKRLPGECRSRTVPR